MAEIPRYNGRTPVDTNDPVVSYTGFSGIKNTVAADRLKDSELVSAVNVDIDNSNALLRREGYTSLVSANVHSIYPDTDGLLYVNGTILYRMNADYSSTAKAQGLSAGLRMRYAEVNGNIYLSNGAETGAYDGKNVRAWGIRAPVTQPNATAIPGVLPAGTYQYAITFEADDQRESGTGLAGVIELDDQQGIHFTNIPVSTDSTVTNKRLYLSPQNGDVLFFAANIGNSVTSYDYVGSVLQLGNQLRTQFLDKPAPMQEIVVWNGRIYGFQYGMLKYTEAFNYELQDQNNYFPLESAGKVIAPVTGGLWVATETNTWFFSGTGPEDFKREVKANYGAIFGTMVYIEHEDLGIVPMWESTQGKVIGTSNGELKNLTRPNYVYTATAVGAGLFKQRAGINQYISVLQG